MKRLLTGFAVLALCGSLAFGASAQTAIQPAPGASQTPMHPGGQGAGMERHPEIIRAQRMLDMAKNDLQHAAHDYDGHRTKALEHVNAALEELRLALAADKK